MLKGSNIHFLLWHDIYPGSWGSGLEYDLTAEEERASRTFLESEKMAACVEWELSSRIKA